MKNTRIYPLRTSSSIWKIKLYSKHICNDMCKFAYIKDYLPDNSTIMFIIDNPEYKDGKCPYSMKLNPSSIQINNFDKNDPYTIDGELLFYNNIVIPDKQIYLNITFPLKEPKNILISSDNDLGFSLSSLLFKIRNVYRWIYQEEENTCSIRTFKIVEQCNCSIEQEKHILESLRDSNNQDNNQDKCPICLEEMKTKKQTLCNHLFHKECIEEWIKNNKNTCPLCRKNLFQCVNNCKNGLIYKQYTGKVIPKNMRGILSRNTTDGVFGIYGYDIDDLFIDEMVYNSSTKVLQFKIFG
jgi:hypothetical protein